MDRMLAKFYAGHTNFTDWYYPSSGLSVTSVAGVCTAGTCTAGNVGAACTQRRASAAARRSTSTRPRCRSAAAAATSRT